MVYEFLAGPHCALDEGRILSRRLLLRPGRCLLKFAMKKIEGNVEQWKNWPIEEEMSALGLFMLLILKYVIKKWKKILICM